MRDKEDARGNGKQRADDGKLMFLNGLEHHPKLPRCECCGKPMNRRARRYEARRGHR